MVRYSNKKKSRCNIIQFGNIANFFLIHLWLNHISLRRGESHFTFGTGAPLSSVAIK